MLTWLEDGSDADGAANTLRQQDLIVLGRNRSHHQTEDVKEGSDQNEVTWTILVVQDSHNRTLDGMSAKGEGSRATNVAYQSHHEEELEGGDP